MRLFARALILSWTLLLPTVSARAQKPAASEPAVNFLFRDQFYLNPSQKIYFKWEDQRLKAEENAWMMRHS